MSHYDVLVIGAGIGGLTAAALLAQSGRRVLVLEGHIEPGGCASSYLRKRPNGDRYIFDVGATLFTGFTDGGAHQRVAERLGLSWPVRPLAPAMDVWLPDRRVTRWGDARWIDERRTAFPAQAWRAERFWREQERVADVAWRFALRQPPVPPETPADLLRLAAAARPEMLHLLRPMLTTVGQTLRRHGLEDRRLRTFVDVQLLISAQATSATCAWLYGAVALDLARLGVFYAEGGAWSLAHTLAAALERHGGEIRYRHWVEAIETRQRQAVAVRTSTGAVFTADQIIANTTLWDAKRLLDAPPGWWLRRAAAVTPEGWGACMLYLGVDAAALPASPAEHHQIVRSYAQPLGEGNSVFVSIHPADDAARAPAGQRAVTISTHTTVAPWWQLREASRAAYREAKQRMAETMLDTVSQAMPALRQHIRFMEVGTPVSFWRYTHRDAGMVGGLPQVRRISGLLSLGPRATGIGNLWLVGDSTFPGQSTAAVTQSALRVVAALEA